MTFRLWRCFFIKCYSDKANFSEYWSVAPLPSTWKHHFEGKGAWLPMLPGAPNTLKMGVLGAPGAPGTLLLYIQNDAFTLREKEQLANI